jgi:alpha-tubulin suppressor-like RCC1 family protein
MFRKIIYLIVFIMLTACDDGTTEQSTQLLSASNITKAFGDKNFIIEVSGGQGSPVQFTSDQPQIASVELNYGLVTLHEVGTATITIKEVNNANQAIFITVTVNQAQVGDAGFSLLDIQDTGLVYGQQNTKIQYTGGNDGELTFDSSNNDVATIDPITGEISITGVGTTIITLSEATSPEFAGQSTSATLSVSQADIGTGDFAQISIIDVTKAYGDANFIFTYTGGNGGQISFDISDLNVATIDPSSGEITIIGVGQTLITLNEAKTSEYAAQSQTAILTVDQASLGAYGYSPLVTSNNNKTYGDPSFTWPKSGGNANPLTYSSSDTNIATINNSGQVSITGVGTTIITLSEATSPEFVGQSTSATLSVSQADIGTGDFAQISIIDVTKAYGDANFIFTYTGGNGGQISFDISDLNVATIDPSSGEIAIVGVGQTLIAINEAQTSEYAAQSQTARLTVYQAQTTDVAYQRLTANPINKAFGDNNFFTDYTGGNNGAKYFSINDPSIANIDYNTGEITLNDVGQTIVRVTEAVTTEFAEQFIDITLTVSQAQLGDSGFTELTTSDTSKAFGAPNFTAPYSGSNGTALTFSSSDLSVATIDVNTGLVTLLSEGTTTLTIIESDTPQFAQQQKNYLLSVYKTRTTALASTYWQFAALRDDGSVVSWGDSDTTPNDNSVDGTNDVLAITGNIYSFAAIREDGSVTAWGNPSWAGADIENTNGQLNGDIDAISITATWAGFAAIREDGSVVNWGYIADGVVIPTDDLNGSIDVVNITSNQYSYAALRIDGSVITWGEANAGGDSNAVASQLDGSVKVKGIYSTNNPSVDNAYAAIREDGSVVTWGEPTRGGDSSSVTAELNGINKVIDIASNQYALAAIRQDGSVISWGNSSFGGDNSAVAAQLDGTIPVVSIASTRLAFAALRNDGSVVTWGSGTPGSKAADIDGTVDVIAIYSSVGDTFAALRDDGKVVAWGGPAGNTTSVDADLDGTIKVISIAVSRSSFAALREDGSVITWGSANEGGDSSAISAQIDGSIPVVNVYGATQAFAALRADGSVITWGNNSYAGDSSSVADRITGNITLALGLDTDRDGIDNDVEWSNCTIPYQLKTGSQPCLSVGETDSDHDGVWDYVEIINGTDPQLNTIQHTMGDLNLDNYPDYWHLPGLNSPTFN